MRTLLLCLCLLLATPAFAGPINVNAADAAALDRELPGIGPALARRIVEYRAAHGDFQEPEDLMKVPYIGVKTFQRLKDYLRFADS